MVTLYFTRKFIKGNLKGICHDDKITFPSIEGCAEWLAAVTKTSAIARRLNYVIVDKSFQNYQR